MAEGWEIGVIIATLVTIVLTYILLKKALVLVRHAEVMIIERFGRYTKTLKPGVYWLWPFIEAPRRVHWRYMDRSNVKRIVTDRIDTREHIIDFPSAHQVITSDNVMVKIDALVYFRISDPRVAVYQVENLPDAIEVLTQSTLRDIIARMTLDDTFSSREVINDALNVKIQRDCERWGVTITRVEIFNIWPPSDIQAAMERQIKSERSRRSTVLQADGQREVAIIRSRGEAARMVLTAEGARAADVLRAEGKAAAKKMLAEAEAASLNDIKRAVSAAGVRAVDYLTAIKYLEMLGGLSRGHSSTKVVLLPTEAVDAIPDLIKLNQPTVA
jgi:regulator of protease activity HflC (stomatin/prohibitin superfamily)